MSDFRAENNYQEVFADRGEASFNNAEQSPAAPPVDAAEKIEQLTDSIDQLQEKIIKFFSPEDGAQLADLDAQLLLSAQSLVKDGRIEDAISFLSRVKTNLTDSSRGEYNWQQSLSEFSSEQDLIDWLTNPMNKLEKNGRLLDNQAMAQDARGIFAAAKRSDKEAYQRLLTKIPSNTVRDKIKQLVPEPVPPVEPPAPVYRDPSLAETPSPSPEESAQPKKEPDFQTQVDQISNIDELIHFVGQLNEIPDQQAQPEKAT